jgi:hypothetical protein
VVTEDSEIITNKIAIAHTVKVFRESGNWIKMSLGTADATKFDASWVYIAKIMN